MNWIKLIRGKGFGLESGEARVSGGKCGCGSRVRLLRHQRKPGVLECYCKRCRRIYEIARPRPGV